MPTNQTANYQLSQWVKSDQVQMEDFNADNAKIDAALKAEADTRAAQTAALNAAVSKLGNCRIDTWSYTGNNQYGQNKPSTIAFSGKPMLVIITQQESFAFFTYGARICPLYCINMSNTGSGLAYAYCTWQGNVLTFYGDTPRAQMNDNLQTYHVFAFYAEDKK